MVSVDHQSVTWAELVATWTRASPTTTAFSARYTATSTTAIPIASLNPRRNTAASAASSTSVTTNWCPCRKCGAYGFSSRCVDASAADRVIVIRKSVAAKPSSTRTRILPLHQDRMRSSMASEPSPCGLSPATRRYTGSAPNRVTRISTMVAIGETAPAARNAIAGW